VKVGRTIALVVPLLLIAAFLLSARITLSQSTYSVRGQVVDMSGGSAGETSVRLYSAQVVRDQVADGDRQFEFKNLPKGTYELEVSAKGFVTRTVDFEIAEKSPEPLSIKFHMDTGGYSQCGPLYQGVSVTYEMRSGKVDLVGVARDQFMARRPGVRVKLVNKGTSQETLSNDKGEFTFSDLEPGKYSLQLTPTTEGYSALPARVWITRENIAKVGVTLVDAWYICHGGPSDGSLIPLESAW
jgi:carboxypeptidase family protein/prealbumin domain-containing protein